MAQFYETYIAVHVSAADEDALYQQFHRILLPLKTCHYDDCLLSPTITSGATLQLILFLLQLCKAVQLSSCDLHSFSKDQSEILRLRKN